MPVLSWLRSCAAVLAFPLMLAYMFLVLGGSIDGLEDNWTSATVLAASAAVLAAGPVCAAAGAWEGARLARGRVLDGAPARGPLTVLTWSLLPLLGAAAVTLAAALGVTAAAMAGVPGLPDPFLVAVAALVILAWTLAGFAAGRFLHPLVGVPLLLGVTWLWLSFPAALETFWVRHLTGNNLGFCCETDSVFRPGALAAQATLAAGLAAAACLAWARRSRRAWAGVAVLPLAAFAVAFPLVRDMGPEAQAPRAGGLACARLDGTGVCVWRERERRLGAAARLAVPAARRLAAGTGLPAPTLITEGPAGGRASWRFAVPPGAGEDEVLFALATGLLPPEPPVCGPGWSGADAYRPVSAWLARTAGAAPAPVAARAGAEAADVAARVLARPAAEQAAWFRRNLAALTRCDAAPSEVTP
ncbi:hypothetical protein Skr01_13080 [Sphaerisporangium krabiense]|uniref:DUF7224 domain-containing protein n=1 Tax=Sphaerisporangium krabiense TaxID=763782 RepID=A0A7W9DV75_9ACTN|nr:hypothetical protein [Sphaerisporangium krabiense]MBB5631165.1 hypothetical protein [Sphaerisporangium krabiense]GII61223.1 hypothetical protein Skr01_13080 [Sphaerisporangium krabiense]